MINETTSCLTKAEIVEGIVPVGAIMGVLFVAFLGFMIYSLWASDEIKRYRQYLYRKKQVQDFLKWRKRE